MDWGRGFNAKALRRQDANPTSDGGGLRSSAVTFAARIIVSRLTLTLWFLPGLQTGLLFLRFVAVLVGRKAAEGCRSPKPRGRLWRLRQEGDVVGGRLRCPRAPTSLGICEILAVRPQYCYSVRVG